MSDLKESLFKNKGFTLIELLVVVSIIGILLALSVFGLQGARKSSRDATRKADLELIRSGLEIYKADCNLYPDALGASLVGDDSSTSCAATNTYISRVPTDPLSPTSSYVYSPNLTSSAYALCTTLENEPSPAHDVTDCGSCTTTCNYKVTNP